LNEETKQIRNEGPHFSRERNSPIFLASIWFDPCSVQFFDFAKSEFETETNFYCSKFINLSFHVFSVRDFASSLQKNLKFSGSMSQKHEKTSLPPELLSIEL
jgi:hypothetical protein